MPQVPQKVQTSALSVVASWSCTVLNVGMLYHRWLSSVINAATI
jgi:hypothetical protein